MNLRVKASAYAPIGRPAALAGFDRQGLAELIYDLEDQDATAGVVLRVLEAIQPGPLASARTAGHKTSLAIGMLVGLTATLAVQRTQTESPPPRASVEARTAMVFRPSPAPAAVVETPIRSKASTAPAMAEATALSARPLRPLVTSGVDVAALAALPSPPATAMAEPPQARPAPVGPAAVEAPIVRSQRQPDLLGGGFSQDRLVESSQGSGLGGDTAQRMASAIGGF